MEPKLYNLALIWEVVLERVGEAGRRVSSVGASVQPLFCTDVIYSKQSPPGKYEQLRGGRNDKVHIYEGCTHI